MSSNMTRMHILELLCFSTAPALLNGSPKENCCPKASVLHSLCPTLKIWRPFKAFHLSKKPFTPPSAKEVLHAVKFCWLECTCRGTASCATTPILAFYVDGCSLNKDEKTLYMILRTVHGDFTPLMNSTTCARDNVDPSCKAPPCMLSKFL